MRPADITACNAALAEAPSRLKLWAMIETCAVVPHLDALAALGGSTRLSTFVMGVNDLAKEMRARLTPERTPFLPILTLAVAAARAHGVAVLDGVCNEFRDLAVFEAEAHQGLLFGFDGKTLIHPDQVAPCNAVFSPSEDELAWAPAVTLTAFGTGFHIVPVARPFLAPGKGPPAGLAGLFGQGRLGIALVRHGGDMGAAPLPRQSRAQICRRALARPNARAIVGACAPSPWHLPFSPRWPSPPLRCTRRQKRRFPMSRKSRSPNYRRCSLRARSPASSWSTPISTGSGGSTRIRASSSTASSR